VSLWSPGNSRNKKCSIERDLVNVKIVNVMEQNRIPPNEKIKPQVPFGKETDKDDYQSRFDDNFKIDFKPVLIAFGIGVAVIIIIGLILHSI
jgi:hypothetical protein